MGKLERIFFLASLIKKQQQTNNAKNVKTINERKTDLKILEEYRLVYFPMPLADVMARPSTQESLRE